MRGLDPRGRKAQCQIDTQNMKHSRYGQDSKDLMNNAKNMRESTQKLKHENLYMNNNQSMCLSLGRILYNILQTGFTSFFA